MSTSASPGPDPLRHDDQGVDDVDVTGGPTSPGPDSTDAGALTSGAGLGVNEPDTGPGPAAADVDGGDDDRTNRI